MGRKRKVGRPKGSKTKKRKSVGKKWGKVGAPKSAKRKRYLKSIRKK